MRFNSIITILLLLTASYSFAQKAYTNSIKAYQIKYIDELEPIIKNDTAYIRFYPISPSYKIKATVEILNNQPVFKMTTSSGKTKEAQKYALVKFSLGGKAYQLYAYQLLALKNNAETANLFFIPFLDKTSGNQSYGGGRYIDFKTDDISTNSLLIDFNKAYNPYCAFTKGYNCPVPPRENMLNAAIKAGERYLADKFEH
jgi:uncharacterized protein